MAKAETRPKAKDETEKPLNSPDAHDASGLSELERMTELTRRIVSVPAKEIAKGKRKHR